jgi:hypothetical protein
MSPILGIYASQISGHLYNNSYTSLQTVTVGSGGASSITFSSIPSTYTHLQIRAMSLTSSAVQIRLDLNGLTGSQSVYSRHHLTGIAAGPVAGGSASPASQFLNQGVATDATYPTVNILDFLDYANTNKYKTIRNLTGIDRNTTDGAITLSSHLYMDTTAISTISISANGANFNQYSSFALYGVN